MKNRNFKNISERLIALLMCLCMIFGLFAMSACNTPADTVEEPDEEPAGESVETVQVLRVIDDIKYGAKFTNDKLSVVTVRADAVPEGAATSISDLKGKFSAAPLYVGDFVTAEKVLDKKPVDADDDAILAIAYANDKIAKLMEGMEVVKAIVVRTGAEIKLVNLILKPKK